MSKLVLIALIRAGLPLKPAHILGDTVDVPIMKLHEIQELVEDALQGDRHAWRLVLKYSGLRPRRLKAELEKIKQAEKHR